MRRVTASAVLLASLVVIGAPAGAAVPVVSIDSGFIERAWLATAKPKTDAVAFIWIPSSSLFDAELFLLGECSRFDGFGIPTGSHKVTFKNIVLTGVDSGNEVLAATGKERLTNGVQVEQAVWILTAAARDLFADDSTILVTGQIKVNKKVDPFDEVQCALGVAEVQEFAGGPLEAPLGADGRLPTVRGLDLPRVLRSAPRP